MNATKKLQVISATRSATEVWLIGQPIPVIDLQCNNQLPTTREVLSRLFYDLKVKKLTLSESCSNVVNEVLLLWQAASIPTTQKSNAVTKLKMIYEKYVKVGKNRKRSSERQKKIEKELSKELKKLFDISHINSEHLIKMTEDWNFLEDQRGERKMIIGGEDKDFKKKQEKKTVRQNKKKEQEEKAKIEHKISFVSSDNAKSISDMDDDGKTSSTEESNDESKFLSKYYRRKISSSGPATATSDCLSDTHKDGSNLSRVNKRKLLDDPLFAASLDRTKTTLRETMHIVTPALRAVGVDVNELTLSTTSIHRSRKLKRVEINEKIRQAFSPRVPLVVHFDSKLLPDSNGASVERIPVVVSGMNIEKILGIPKLPSATGFNMGKTVVRLIREWEGVAEWIAALCYDTTSTNTGAHTGAITVIQKEFQKHLLFMGCRHHILEILATSVFEIFFPSSGPQIAIFGRFREAWPFINQENYATVDQQTPGYVLTEKEKLWLENNRDDVIQFLGKLLTKQVQPRRDYLEFIKLAQIALGASDQVDGNMFSIPGAYHRARWMAKGIYCLKILCFRNEFSLTFYEIQALKRISIFTLTVYIKMWFSAPSSCDAPFNDLHLLQILELYKETDQQVAVTALKKLKGQLWYLSEDLVGLAFFSDRVPSEEKTAMVRALQRSKSKKVLRRLDANQVKSFQEKKLSEFVTEQTSNLFTVLKLDITFLRFDVNTWPERVDYVHAKEVVSSLKVVNDCAERAVKLANDFNLELTHDEVQRQLIFQIVEYHRKLLDFPHKKNFK